MGAQADKENAAFQAWRDGPTDATELALVELLRSHAFAVCWLLLQEHPEGLVNECAYAALRGAKGFRGDSSFSTWFQALVQNRCKSYLEEKITRRQREVSLETPAGEGTTVGDTLEAPAENDTDRLAVEQLMGKLRDDERELLRRHLAGETAAEIAEGMGLPSARAAQKWLERTREKLTGLLNTGARIAM